MTTLLDRTLSHYRLVAELGRGGMGVVYRATDEKLGRDVAIKVLPPDLVADPERRRRFLREARTAAAINHPNVATTYEVGEADGRIFIAMELVEGETLRAALTRGKLPVREAVRVTAAIAHGLARAHAAHVVHRDLKPENVILGPRKEVKILDFGLAKWVEEEKARPGSRRSAAETETDRLTRQGMRMGTPPYMSPEQVRGEAVDSRSDLFTLGSMLYEMLSGHQAFGGDTQVEVLHAVLKAEPPELSEIAEGVPAPLIALVRHCLEKSPEERFQSAQDLAFQLESLPAVSGMVPAVAVVPPMVRRGSVIVAVTAAVIVAVAAAAGLWLGRQTAEYPVPSYQRVTFRRGNVWSARFSPDGNTIVYSASWEERPAELFSTRVDTLGSRPLGLAGAHPVATAGGEMAVILEDSVLATMPLDGGTPRPIAENVLAADWVGGDLFAVVRSVEGRRQLEFPIGTVLYETDGPLLNPRIQPGGERVAFVARPAWTGAWAGTVMSIDGTGNAVTLSGPWKTIDGLAWSPDGAEVWFAAEKSGVQPDLQAVSLDGEERVLAASPGGFSLHDVFPDGRVLLAHTAFRLEMRGRMEGQEQEQDLTWLDGTAAGMDLSDDGTTLMFSEGGEAGGLLGSVYLRRSGGGVPVRLGEGEGPSFGHPQLSPDKEWVISVKTEAFVPGSQLTLLPTGPGEPRPLPKGTLERITGAGWLPDGKRLLLMGHEPDRPRRHFVQEVPDGEPRPVTPEGVLSRLLTPDGRFIIHPWQLPLGEDALAYPVDGGEPRPLLEVWPSLSVLTERGEGWGPMEWSEDGRSLFVWKREGPVFWFNRLDLESGDIEPWLELTPPDPVGVGFIWGALITPDGRHYLYGYYRQLSDLFVVEGL